MNLNEILFWTEKEDLENDETSSRDPLGTETFAGQLAELILPGLTTITWRVRYLTVICLWLKFIKEELQEENTDKILEHIKNLEKLTAYCIIKRYSESEDDSQTGNLIGKRYAKAYFNKNIGKFSVDKKYFSFLVNHGSAGAFATYKVLLKAFGYIDEDYDYTLTSQGEGLVERLQIPHSLFVKNILQGEKVDSHSKKFDTLGEFFGLCNFDKSASERTRLIDAICADNMRNTSFMFIKRYSQELEFNTLNKIAEAKGANEYESRVITICDYITRFERVNREIHYIFYSLMDIDANQIDISDFIRNAEIQDSLKMITDEALDDYLEFHATNEQLLGQYDERPFQLFKQLKEFRNDNGQCIKTMIEYHVKNQKQKSKAPWIDYKNGKCVVILKQYRKDTEDIEGIRASAVHSYRIRNARKMIDDLEI